MRALVIALLLGIHHFAGAHTWIYEGNQLAWALSASMLLTLWFPLANLNLLSVPARAVHDWMRRQYVCRVIVFRVGWCLFAGLLTVLITLRADQDCTAIDTLLADSIFLVLLVLPLFSSAAGNNFLVQHLAGADAGSTKDKTLSALSQAWRELLAELGVSVLPAYLFLIGTTLIEGWGIGQSPSMGIIVAVSMLGGLLLLFPLLLAVVWNTEPLRHEDAQRMISGLSHQMGMAPPRMGLWHAPGRGVNAVVTGFLPRLRWIYVSQQLLKSFTPTELRFVVGHELAHLRNSHLMWRLLALLLPVVAVAGLGVTTNFAEPRISQWSLQLAVAGLLGIAYFRWAFAPFCCLLERESDLWACIDWEGKRKRPVGHLQPEEYLNTDAAEAGLSRLAATHGWDSGGMVHPTLRERLALVRLIQLQPDFASLFLHKTGRTKWALAAAFSFALLAAIARHSS